MDELKLNDKPIEPDDQDDYGDEDEGYCFTCSNTGYVNCYCGGDLCVCSNYGEKPCPACG